MTTRNESDSGVLNEAIELSNAIQKLNNTSNSRLAAAKECFTTAKERANDAFSNEAFTLSDRIMATKLRVVAKILECLQDTEAAVAGCIMFLEELHNLPPIRATFSTYFKGGFKSRVYKDSRLENVKSVLSLNFAISEFMQRFSGELPDVTNWLRIHLPTRGETINPLVIDPFIVKEIFGNEEPRLPENQLTSENLIFHVCSINSKREVLGVSWYNTNCINIVNRSGNMKRFCELRQATSNPKGDKQYVVALAIDRNDNVFVIIRYKDGTSNEHVYVLFVFGSADEEQHEHVLDIESSLFKRLNLCVVNNEIFIHPHWNDFIYICDIKGNLKSGLALEQNSNYHSGDFVSMECVTDDDDIVMRTRQNVLVYTKGGKLKRTIKVKNDICGARYNHVTSKIEILVKKESTVLRKKSYYILSYSDSDEFDCLHLPMDSNSWKLRFYQHAAGSTAFIIYNARAMESIIFM